MKKLTILFAFLSFSTGLWAIENVHYIDANGVEQTVDGVNVITDASEKVSWGTVGQTTWYVVTDSVTLSKGAICIGAVNLILADNAKLTAIQAGIQVSGTDNSLTIYAQSTDTTAMGQLIATSTTEQVAGIGGELDGSNSNVTINGGTITAKGGNGSPGIGGGNHGSGSNITINGGNVKANGTTGGAGIGGGHSGYGSNIIINGGNVTANGANGGAGIGDGCSGSFSNITINGGTVTATGAGGGAGIGGGKGGSTSNVIINDGMIVATGGVSCVGIGHGLNGSIQLVQVATSLIIKAGTSAPADQIATTRTSETNIKSDLDGKQYVFIESKILSVKTDAIDSVNAAISETDNDDIKTIAANAVVAIDATTTLDEVNNVKSFALTALAAAKAAYSAGKAEILGEMATPCSKCPAVIVNKGDKSVTLYAPESVEYIKTTE